MPHTAAKQRMNSDNSDKHERSGSTASEDRDTMTTYWKRNSNPNLENMMLDTNAEKLNRIEFPEILECIPDLHEKRVLELGAGIGRFTKTFAQLSKSVIAVDFMESFLEKNREENSHYGNVEFVQMDATQLEFEPNSFDLVFSNWLLMYLNDDEVESLLQKSLKWLTHGGALFFRESCFHSSGDIKPEENPTHYRSPRHYIDVAQSRVLQEDKNQEPEVYELVFAKALESYYEIKNNNNQVCFLFMKTKLQDHHGYKTLNDFLDNSEYAEKNIKKYESVRGEGFVTIGGIELTRELIQRLNLTSKHRLLNFGSATGGSTFVMAKEYNCEIVGVDISANMIGISWDRALQQQKGYKIRFEIGEGTKMRFPPSKFDAIYSRDVIFHVADKRTLLNNFYMWLKEGGKLLITDFCCGDTAWSQELIDYVRLGEYQLTKMQDYAKLLEECGFTQVKAEDSSDLYQQYCKKEMKTAEENRSKLHMNITRPELDECARQWKLKFSLTNSGQRRWCIFEATKSSSSCVETSDDQ
ncbi:unnamed protein product [Didymodactylos carnosus]|uniref:phosphoethanolamine N-methyltransferase n=1 Tax=Didymodactylos carnosus TaxID=1234261 RepID=A0A813Q724_9BILA|nr:unnamed protein product [Didymodactylos carnosus]CAF0762835.1 unnamed protein product [Didymodactylos carnosus]CAF3511741.1 unnamed protein product [Didymodactylos carnosus]CAF3543916.1 unnamed protein product [Didymodactylos carnosus]